MTLRLVALQESDLFRKSIRSHRGKANHNRTFVLGSTTSQRSVSSSSLEEKNIAWQAMGFLLLCDASGFQGTSIRNGVGRTSDIIVKSLTRVVSQKIIKIALRMYVTTIPTNPMIDARSSWYFHRSGRRKYIVTAQNIRFSMTAIILRKSM